MAWVTGGVTTLVEQTQGVNVLQEVIESGNAIVYSRTDDVVLALDGSVVVVASDTPDPDVIEIPPSAVFVIERTVLPSTLEEVTP